MMGHIQDNMIPRLSSIKSSRSHLIIICMIILMVAIPSVVSQVYVYCTDADHQEENYQDPCPPYMCGPNKDIRCVYDSFKLWEQEAQCITQLPNWDWDYSPCLPDWQSCKTKAPCFQPREWYLESNPSKIYRDHTICSAANINAAQQSPQYVVWKTCHFSPGEMGPWQKEYPEDLEPVDVLLDCPDGFYPKSNLLDVCQLEYSPDPCLPLDEEDPDAVLQEYSKPTIRIKFSVIDPWGELKPAVTFKDKSFATYYPHKSTWKVIGSTTTLPISPPPGVGSYYPFDDQLRLSCLESHFCSEDGTTATEANTTLCETELCQRWETPYKSFTLDMNLYAWKELNSPDNGVECVKSAFKYQCINSADCPNKCTKCDSTTKPSPKYECLTVDSASKLKISPELCQDLMDTSASGYFKESACQCGFEYHYISNNQAVAKDDILTDICDGSATLKDVVNITCVHDGATIPCFEDDLEKEYAVVPIIDESCFVFTRLMCKNYLYDKNDKDSQEYVECDDLVQPPCAECGLVEDFAQGCLDFDIRTQSYSDEWASLDECGELYQIYKTNLKQAELCQCINHCSQVKYESGDEIDTGKVIKCEDNGGFAGYPGRTTTCSPEPVKREHVCLVRQTDDVYKVTACDKDTIIETKYTYPTPSTCSIGQECNIAPNKRDSDGKADTEWKPCEEVTLDEACSIPTYFNPCDYTFGVDEASQRCVYYGADGNILQDETPDDKICTVHTKQHRCLCDPNLVLYCSSVSNPDDIADDDVSECHNEDFGWTEGQECGLVERRYAYNKDKDGKYVVAAQEHRQTVYMYRFSGEGCTIKGLCGLPGSSIDNGEWGPCTGDYGFEPCLEPSDIQCNTDSHRDVYGIFEGIGTSNDVIKAFKALLPGDIDDKQIPDYDELLAQIKQSVVDSMTNIEITRQCPCGPIVLCSLDKRGHNLDVCNDHFWPQCEYCKGVDIDLRRYVWCRDVDGELTPYDSTDKDSPCSGLGDYDTIKPCQGTNECTISWRCTEHIYNDSSQILPTLASDECTKDNAFPNKDTTVCYATDTLPLKADFCTTDGFFYRNASCIVEVDGKEVSHIQAGPLCDTPPQTAHSFKSGCSIQTNCESYGNLSISCSRCLSNTPTKVTWTWSGDEDSKATLKMKLSSGVSVQDYLISTDVLLSDKELTFAIPQLGLEYDISVVLEMVVNDDNDNEYIALTVPFIITSSYLTAEDICESLGCFEPNVVAERPCKTLNGSQVCNCIDSDKIEYLDELCNSPVQCNPPDPSTPPKDQGEVDNDDEGNSVTPVCRNGGFYNKIDEVDHSIPLKEQCDSVCTCREGYDVATQCQTCREDYACPIDQGISYPSSQSGCGCSSCYRGYSGPACSACSLFLGWTFNIIPEYSRDIFNTIDTITPSRAIFDVQMIDTLSSLLDISSSMIQRIPSAHDKMAIIYRVDGICPPDVIENPTIEDPTVEDPSEPVQPTHESTMNPSPKRFISLLQDDHLENVKTTFFSDAVQQALMKHPSIISLGASDSEPVYFLPSATTGPVGSPAILPAPTCLEERCIEEPTAEESSSNNTSLVLGLTLGIIGGIILIVAIVIIVIYCHKKSQENGTHQSSNVKGTNHSEENGILELI